MVVVAQVVIYVYCILLLIPLFVTRLKLWWILKDGQSFSLVMVSRAGDGGWRAGAPLWIGESLCYLVCSFHPSISPLSIVIKSNLNSYLFPGFLRIDSIQTERSRVPQIASTLFRSSEQSKKEIRTRAYLNQPFLIVYLSSLRHLRQEQHLNMFDFRFLFSSKVDKWLPRQKNAIPYRDNGVCVLFSSDSTVERFFAQDQVFVVTLSPRY